VKFVLDELEITHAIYWLNMIGCKRAYPTRTVNSVYFDTNTRQAAQENLSGTAERRKIRLRWYGTDASSSHGQRLEVKSRSGRVGSKVIYPLSMSYKYLTCCSLREVSQRVFDDVVNAHFTRNTFCNHLIPTLFVGYQREYFLVKKNIHITIDTNIEFSHVMCHKSINSHTRLAYNKYVMEIKLPHWLRNDAANLMRSLNLTPKRHSKYLAGLASLGLQSYI
jgi:hypothetical protein